MSSDLAPEIIQLKDRCVVDADDFEWWLEQKQWSWQGLSRGEYGIDIDNAQLLYVMEDPVLWARAYLSEPDTGEPYEFWEYQLPSIRSWFQNAIHQDGAEVGKTREITVLLLWGHCTGFGGSIRNPWSLVAAPQQTHLDEIIMAIEEHVGVDNTDSEKPFINHFWRRPKKHPHYMMRFVTPNPWNPKRPNIGRIYYRPLGHDGEAARGVHVNAMGLVDEAAKVKNPVCWSEFFRALKPGAVFRGYSVPDGDNTTEFYKMTQRAIPNLAPDQDGMRLFHWAKNMMPDPFWNKDRDKLFQDHFGGRDSPGYQRNVLGLHGQQKNPVWPWALLQQNIRDVPEYRTLKLIVDEATGEMQVQAYRVEVEVHENRKAPKEHTLIDRDDDLSDYRSSETRRDAFRRLLREVFSAPANAVLWAGADLGFSKDPTEILVSQEIGTELRDIIRIHAKGVSYDMQCELMYCLDEFLGFAANFGVDFGSAGTAVVQILQNEAIYEEGHYEERMTGFMFAAAMDAVDEEGDPLTEENKHGDEVAVRLPAKELATNLITARFQRMGWALPYDNEVIGHHSNHTAREGARNRIFDKKDDHTIDARRTLILRKAFNEDSGADVFGSGVHDRGAA